MNKKSLPSPRKPRPSMKEIRREFVQGLIVERGLEVWRCWPSFNKLAKLHAIDPETIRTAATKVGRDGLSWIQHQAQFQKACELSDQEEERKQLCQVEARVRFRMGIDQLAEKVADGALRTYLRGEASPECQTLFLDTLAKLRELGEVTLGDDAWQAPNYIDLARTLAKLYS